MLQYFNADQGTETEEDNSIVIIADKLINSLVIKRIAEIFPTECIVGEEESAAEYGLGRKMDMRSNRRNRRISLGNPSFNVFFGLCRGWNTYCRCSRMTNFQIRCE